jgi:hypothetical protein
MPFSVTCQGCGHVSAAPDEFEGRRGRCRKCGHVFELSRPVAAGPSSPIKPYSTGWRTMVNGRFVAVDAHHIESATAPERLRTPEADDASRD